MKRLAYLLHYFYLSSILVSEQTTRTILGGALPTYDVINVSATAELRKNPSLSTPDECARACREGEPPKICYYHFTLENFRVLGAACKDCTPSPNTTNSTNSSSCQSALTHDSGRNFLVANRMLPGPNIQVCEGDAVVVDVTNLIHLQGVAIHWHGIHQKGTQHSDGASYVTQCPIQAGNTFRYQWNTDENAGTHFWHADSNLQQLHGLYGSIVIRQPPRSDPNSHLYEYDLLEHVIIISDWVDERALERFPGLMNSAEGQAGGTFLINGKGQTIDPITGYKTNTPLEVFTITPGRRYRFRLINAMSTICLVELNIQGHNLNLIATDGVPVQPVQIDTIISFSGERFDFVINADQNIADYWIHVRGLGECNVKREQQLATLRYSGGPNQPASKLPSSDDDGLHQGVVLNPLDAICGKKRADAICVDQLKRAFPINDKELLDEESDVKLILSFKSLVKQSEQPLSPSTYNRPLVTPTGNQVKRSLINEISYVYSPAPPLSQIADRVILKKVMTHIPPEQFCNGDNRPPNCGQMCMCTHKINISRSAIVEIILIDDVPAANLSHPFHLHGYAFYVLGMGRALDHNITTLNSKHVLDLDKRGLLQRNFDLPPGKDTIMVPTNGYVVIRFRANNPGFWSLNCQFFAASGMNLMFQVDGDLPPTPLNFPKCGNFLQPITSPATPHGRSII